MSRTTARVRERLYHFQGRRCWWCRRRCRLLTADEARALMHRLPDNAATIDHMYSRLNARRAEVNPLVMACYACNQKRNQEETLATPIEVRRALSKRSLSKEEV